MRRSIRRCNDCGQRFSSDAAFCPFDGAKLESAAWDPGADGLIGQRIDGRYEIVAVLGEGGMGKVYKVRHISLDRYFAMKVLRRDLARDAELAARFIQEAKTTASVRHPNIVSITDFGRFPDDVPYFVMELLSGQTLGEVIRAGGPIPAARAVRIITQIAGALGAAHAAGIVHRDLKPDNVFLVGGVTGGVASDELRIVDFGAAKIIGASRLTKAGIVFGTPHYMSPEQASGGTVDHRADVYSLGIIMYEMFTGRVPFEADTYMGVLTQHMFVQPIPPSQVNAAAKELGALEDITLRALEKKPEDRYESMDELAKDVDRVTRMSHGRLQVAPHLEGGRASRPPRSMRYKMADELEPPTLEEMRVAIDSMLPPKRRFPWGFIAGGLAVTGVAVGAAVLASRGAGPGPAPSAASASQPAIEAPASSVAASAASAARVVPAVARSVTVSATPTAEVYAGAALVGTTPLEIRFVPEDAPKYTLKATGYVDSDVVLDTKTASELKIELRKITAPPPVTAAPPRPPAAQGHAAQPRQPGAGIEDLPPVGVWSKRQ